MANNVIGGGMFIEGKHVTVRKMLSELRQCLKCQKYGHHVLDCEAGDDICARCSRHHCTSLCDVTDQASFSCANCVGDTAKGHGAADRNCPKFLQEKGKILECAPENKYEFFPTDDDPQSWRLLNEPSP
jgi:hypothetical protein